MKKKLIFHLFIFSLGRNFSLKDEKERNNNRDILHT